MSEHDDESQERPNPPPETRPKPEPLRVQPVDHDYIEKDASSQGIETRDVRPAEEK